MSPPFGDDAVSVEAVFQFLGQHDREEGAEDMAADRDVAAAVDRAGGRHGLDLPDQLLDPQQIAVGVPANAEGRHDRQVMAGRRAEEIDHRDLAHHRLVQASVIGRIPVDPHEGVLYGISACVDLMMRLALVVIPDPETWFGFSAAIAPAGVLKIPRCGLTSGMRSPPNSNSPARSAANWGSVAVSCIDHRSTDSSGLWPNALCRRERLEATLACSRARVAG
jgi:hypothetical protein